MTDDQITEAMIDVGGSFVRALGTLWRVADPENQRRLKAAFPEYWAKYAERAERLRNT
mgnify:CR=1 FL=1